MSVRSVVIGFALALAIAGSGYLNDSMLRVTMMVGNHFPISVFGLLILVAVLLNPLLYLLKPRWRLHTRELAVIVTMALVACSIPGSGLMRHFPTSLVLPLHYNQLSAGWRKHQVLQYAPPRMLPAGGRADPEVVDRFLKGGASAREEGFGLSEVFDTDHVPWHKWQAMLLTWYPIILLTAVCVICLSLIVHPQWARRERLRYPVATVGQVIMEQDEGCAVGRVFRNRLFWLGFAIVFCLHLVNGLARLYPDVMVSIPVRFPMPQILQQWPRLNTMYADKLFAPVLYPTVVAFAFFLASDVSFSLGISQIVHVLLLATLIAAGVEMSGSRMLGGPVEFQKFGSYLGVGVMLLYIGRRFYWDTLKQAIGFRAQEGTVRYAVWACRILMAAMAALVLLLAVPGFGIGLAWPFAVLFVVLALLLFVVMARVNAESGLFFIAPGWQPIGVMVGLFGLAALGPTSIVILGLLCTIITSDAREVLMPFVVNGLKMSDDARIRPGRTGAISGVVYVAALAVATIVVFWACYNFGGPWRDAWAWKHTPKFTFDAAARAASDLKQSGQLAASEQLGSIDRLAAMDPRQGFLNWAGLGLGLVLVASVLRLRYTRWPIHPVMFLAWGTYPMAMFSHSFLLGWILKSAVTKFGGGRAYRAAIPLLIGVVAGDLLGGLTFMVQGAAHYALFGTRLPWSRLYHVFPV